MADTENAPPAARVEPVWDQNRTRGDEPPAAGTSRGYFGISSGDRMMLAAIAAVALVIGIVNAFSFAQDAAWRGDSYDIGRRLFWEMSSIAVILLLLPILVLAVRRMRRTPGLAAQAAIGAIALLGFSTLHITGMVWVRKLALWLAGGAYDFRFSLATVLYEFRKDAVAFVLIAATIWLLESRRELKSAAVASSAPPTPPQPSSPDLIWVRDGTSRIRVVPRDILWVASAGNYIEYSLADGTQHLIRGTLAAAESELARFSIVRVHRTKLANLDRVRGVDLKPSGDFELAFDNGQTLGGSRRYRPAVALLGSRTGPAGSPQAPPKQS
ncbi:MULTISPECIES: LytTR family DNA-binding domain-containing protein [unclassified Bradyrhizobium]|uniref:LytTR family DNA-binding domain-containing protein n=1 Tax=unclassified Bradyrhizobium TaxID=2631580 RepID=UPI001CD41569|nr:MULTISPECIES: LytTR family DNA-binding domain-containing protein [unclassified Bradyrhizobium]MCA1426314.1 LytTR family transcriptional regulator DNA-binding domain-containing protein [Bradyrhizobium sp. NBAIM16]MCA1503676.1 LytTR family transcriptional regulator DNA-binding domain-containing protein [Bradyrhizobium sp. NBAIM02]